MLVLSDNNDYLDENVRLGRPARVEMMCHMHGCMGPMLSSSGPVRTPRAMTGSSGPSHMPNAAVLHSSLYLAYSLLPSLTHKHSYPRYYDTFILARPELFKVQNSLFYTTTTLIYKAPSILRHTYSCKTQTF